MVDTKAVELRSNRPFVAQGRQRGRLATFLVRGSTHISREESFMNSAINPETAQPSTTQAFKQSDRNPLVTSWAGTEADGVQLPAPASSESRVTQPGPAPSANAGLTNYDTGDSADAVEDEAEREG